VLLPRAECERRIKRVVSRAADDTDPPQSSALQSTDNVTSTS
jgi:hypothetical protein